MFDEPGDVAASALWAESHPGLAALVAAVASYAGLAAVTIGFVQRLAVAPGGHAGPMWAAMAILVGAMVFVVALPAALGFAAACCATQRELGAGLVGGVAALFVALAALAVVGPSHVV